jgi:membrane protease YdiL (CAAX protease family)
MDLDAPPSPAEAGGQAEPLTPRQVARRALVAIIVTAVLFAAVHFPQPQSIPAIFLLALGLGYAYERTGSLVAPIVMHMIFNAVNMLIFMVPEFEKYATGGLWPMTRLLQ